MQWKHEHMTATLPAVNLVAQGDMHYKALLLCVNF